MDFVIAKKDDKHFVKKLWSYCFTDSDEYIEHYFENIYDENNNYLVKEDGDIKASLMANPYMISIDKNISKTSYIVGVSSNAIDRGKGYASYLIKESLKDRYKKGENISMLMPIDTKIYTRYGYANIFDMLEMNIDLRDMEVKKHKNLKAVVYDDKRYIVDLIKIYNEYIKDFGAFFVRDKKYFENFEREVKLERGYIYIIYEGDNPIAYMIFYPKYIVGKTGFVREIFSLSNKGYDKLFEIIKSHYTQIQDLILHTNENSYIQNYFMQDNKIIYKKKKFIMARVLNVYNILSNLSFKAEFCIKINDDIIKENNSTFEIKQDSVEITDKAPDIEMSIYDFTQVYFGYLSLEDIIFKNDIKLQENMKKILEKIFFKKENYFNDYV